MKHPSAMQKFAKEQRQKDPDCKITVTVGVNKQPLRKYFFDAVAIVGIKKGSKVEIDGFSKCELDGEVTGINGAGMNKRHLKRGLRRLLKSLGRYKG